MTQGTHRRGAFLDRDGVLNVDHGYVHRPEDLQLVPGASQAVAKLNEAGYTVVVVTNQSGVARGMYTEADVDAFHAHMTRVFDKLRARIDAFYSCPYHHEAEVEAYLHEDHPDRKPNPGMIERAISDLALERDGSFLIGDKESDMAAADAAGIAGHRFSGGRLDDLVNRILSQAKG
ncbi:D-glycero-alpha-D-manno-heptose-1,7-bisphosphate 7-phosphatase [Tepidamorphus sp. 3E244]|uniref:D-glycero-alpha-D-manno-heptose-1,7-bisphosphate 7-phosphatase n=1 Tax=Tepidamorphus sp. 3E244 TaxID=3385498 RepID=UPI0038FCC235